MMKRTVLLGILGTLGVMLMAGVAFGAADNQVVTLTIPELFEVTAPGNDTITVTAAAMNATEIEGSLQSLTGHANTGYKVTVQATAQSGAYFTVTGATVTNFVIKGGSIGGYTAVAGTGGTANTLVTSASKPTGGDISITDIQYKVTGLDWDQDPANPTITLTYTVLAD